MCLITFSWRPGSRFPLRLAGNRDEFHARPTAPLAHWDGKPLLGGRDLEAGGTWLAANRQGVVAALTNVRDTRLSPPAHPPSRGELVANVLASENPAKWLRQMAEHGAARYAGFNLLVATPTHCWHLHRGRHDVTLTDVAEGVHGLSNASLNTAWPKLQAVRHALSQHETTLWRRATRQALHDASLAEDAALPDTGVGLTLERQLSAAFILGEAYGTRATTWLSLSAQGDVTLTEQRFGPLGRFLGETTLATPAYREY
ncbi:NRDE family protein [Halomonas sp. NyZ770]|uniref:NRDE family protein n=1 Tax=Halomonas sp. NyZ770 TaxID=2883106 RepID=UPI001D0B551F|nr:NRDE family protein [Halomonas sp. NyZ770]UDM08461.1 NRDE family protein [Halomonas sp. NyZ770]